MSRLQQGASNTTVSSGIRLTSNSPSKILASALKRYTSIINGESFAKPASYKQRKIAADGRLAGLTVNVSSDNETLSLSTDESYTLDVPSDGQANLTASTVFGAIRGLETFSQLIISDNDGGRVVLNTPVHIVDRPAMPHRGLLLDTTRNYYPVKDIYRTLDAMSYNKLNVFHWHIVDSQSWPIQSKTFPELQQKGAYGPDMQYSHTDVQNIIAYARDRGIRVIPEFDVPGHTYTVGQSFPNIMSCLNVQPNWDQYAAEPPSGQLNIALPEAANFTNKLVNEYAKLFTDSVFHLGGDEVNRKCWGDDPHVQEYLKAHPGQTVETLLAKFYDAVHTNLVGQGKVGMSWEETLFHSQYTPPNGTIIQTWIDQESIAKTVAKGYRAVASPASSYYLDCGHGTWLSNIDGNSWCDPFKTWMRIYNFDPLANITSAEQQKLVIGAEVALWSEQSDSTVLDSHLWPRACAVAETAWSGKKDAKGLVRTTAEVAHRLHDQRFRMVGRGIGAEPLQPLWCARNPGKCHLP
ncbi:Glucosamine-6-phosphate isomerase (Glucosamine-6-phosphate deaminase) (GNPDA) (GlcN6P deaminase) [Dipsacomyces acuminosporus]|nr:Glucosamine-6-phosphate isomerase (Glucosamine-6-phosphate deaminase) (GNPDA) (GlcN6P deaminase) [Dipsacomyces acuminosporus]